jgi:hypothetical protein
LKPLIRCQTLRQRTGIGGPASRRPGHLLCANGDLHDRFVGSIFNKAGRRRDEAFQPSGKAINEKDFSQVAIVALAGKLTSVSSSVEK